jgi:hypothetical protein
MQKDITHLEHVGTIFLKALQQILQDTSHCLLLVFNHTAIMKN